MQCGKCGSSTQVTNSRNPQSAPRALTGALVKEVRHAVEWYTPEWVARTRVCVACGDVSSTVEIYVDDLAAMLKEMSAP